MLNQPFSDLVMTTSFFHSPDIDDLQDALTCDYRHVCAVPADAGNGFPKPVAAESSHGTLSHDDGAQGLVPQGSRAAREPGHGV